MIKQISQMRILKEYDGKRKNKIIFFFTIALMILTHGFCFLNIMFTHDSLWFVNENDVARVAAGRWFYPFFLYARHFATPWLMGCLSILFVSLSVVIVSEVLDFDLFQGLCASLVFSANLTLTALFGSFIHDADADCMSLFLACFAVYSFEKFPKYINAIVALLSMVLCLGIYQTYFSMSLGLFLFILVKDTKYVKNIKELICAIGQGVKIFFLIIGTLLVYGLILYFSPVIYNVKLSNWYNSVDQLSGINIDKVIRSIPFAYNSFMEVFSRLAEENGTKNNYFGLLFLIILFMTIILCIWESKDFLLKWIIILPVVLLMPLALNAICLVSNGLLHFLMTYAVNLFFLFPFIFINMTDGIEKPTTLMQKTYNKIRKGISIACILLIVLIGMQNIVYANGAYVYKKLVYENTVLHAHTIWRDVNDTEGYQEGVTKVVFMGSFENSKAAYHSSLEKRYDGLLIGMRDTAITYDLVTNAFYRNILGRNLKIENNDTNILTMEEFKEMPTYPKKGYCKMIGDCVVVKISN